MTRASRRPIGAGTSTRECPVKKICMCVLVDGAGARSERRGGTGGKVDGHKGVRRSIVRPGSHANPQMIVG